MGYQFNISDALNAFHTHLAWRARIGADNFIREYIDCAMLDYPDFIQPENAPTHTKITQCFPLNVLLRDADGQILFDKNGDIISIERPGLLDEKRFTTEICAEDFLAWHSFQLEFRSKLLDSLSVEYGRLVKTVLILDLAGLSARSVNRQTINLLRQSVQVAAENYPESLHSIFFVNTPRIFAAIWNTMKGWMTQKTISKIKLLDSDFEKTIFQEIGRQNLPAFLGGTCSSPLADMPLSDDRFGLGPGRVKLIVGPRKKEVLRMQVTGGSQLNWSWGVLENEIVFSIRFKLAKKHPPPSYYLKPAEKYDASKTQRGLVTAPADGTMICAWDNSWGFLQSRTIYYKVEELKEIDISESLRDIPLQEMLDGESSSNS